MKKKPAATDMPEFLILLSDANAKAPKLHGFAGHDDLEEALTAVVHDPENFDRKVTVYGLTPIVVSRKVEIEGLPRRKRRAKAAA